MAMASGEGALSGAEGVRDPEDRGDRGDRGDTVLHVSMGHGVLRRSMGIVNGAWARGANKIEIPSFVSNRQRQVKGM